MSIKYKKRKLASSVYTEALLKIEPTHHKSLCTLFFVSRLSTIWVIMFWNNSNVTFQGKAKCMEKTSLCLWQMARACNFYTKIPFTYLIIYKYTLIFRLTNFIWYVIMLVTSAPLSHIIHLSLESSVPFLEELLYYCF